MWPFIGLRDLLRIEKTSFYGYGGYVYEIVDKESSGIIVVIQVSYYLTETSMLGGIPWFPVSKFKVYFSGSKVLRGKQEES